MLLVIEEARQLGLPLRLQVMKVNPRARTFYERLGFIHTGETDTHILMERAS
jgi:RimJ/RimL family protein N-acetyltransferase